MTVAPWGDSCKCMRYWECLLVRGSARWHSRLYGRPMGAVRARESSEISVQCFYCLSASGQPWGTSAQAAGARLWVSSTVLRAVHATRAWAGTLRGRGTALRGVLSVSQIQAVGRCELVALGSSWGSVYLEDVHFFIWVRTWGFMLGMGGRIRM